jgi:cellulose biosynthesis protein BcsQ
MTDAVIAQPASRTARRGHVAPPDRPLIAVVANVKGGTGKTTDVLGLAAMAASLGLNTLVVDSDTQPGAYVLSAAMEGKARYRYLRETDPEQLRYLRDIADVHLVLVDTPGSLQAGGAAEHAAIYADIILVPTDMSPLVVGGTMQTVDYILRRGGNMAVLLNGLTPGNVTLERDARAFLAGYEVTAEDTADAPVIVKGVPCFRSTIRRYVAHAGVVKMGIPITAFNGPGSGQARADLLQVLLELVAYSPDLKTYVSSLT